MKRATTVLKLEELLADYNTRDGNAQLTLDEVRKSFLEPDKPNWRSLATSLISFVLEWKDRGQWLDLRPGLGTTEPFFLHLFKGCLLFESLLKENPRVIPRGNTLGMVLCELSCELVGKVNCDIHVIKGKKKSKWRKTCWDISESDLKQLIDDLPDHGRSIEETITLTGRLRNTLGHNLGWVVDMDRGKYDCLVRTVGASCLHVIARLYRDEVDRDQTDRESR